MKTLNEPQFVEFIEELFSNSSQNYYLQHVLRVVKNAKLIGEKEEVNLNIVIPAAYLHDIGRTISSDINIHVEKSISISKLFLKTLGYSGEEISLINGAIADHNISPNDPHTEEGKVLFDADKLELVGNIGIANWLRSLGSQDMLLGCQRYIELTKMVTKRRETFFYTKTGKILGDKKFFQTLSFFQQLINELS